MSLPWILTEHVLSLRNGPLMPLLFAPARGYCAAAAAALHLHRQQHLYAEIEAETSLAFDQILFALSEQALTLTCMHSQI